MILKQRNKEDLAEEAASLIKKSINKLLKKQEFVVFGIPGGRSVQSIFKLLKKIQWNKVHIFMIDERWVPIRSEESNFRLAKENFIDKLIESKALPEKNVHAFDYKKGVEEYSKEIKKYGGKFDIILLSSGEDGHIASLFPNYSIKDNSKYFIEVNNSPKPPKKRMSASRNLLKKAKVAILLFSGKEKEDAFKKFLDKKTSINNCPAKLVGKIKENYVLTDIYH